MKQTDLYVVTVAPIIKTLNAFDSILSKLSAHAGTKATERRPAAVHEEALLNDRLVFDQFPLLMQVRVACDNAKAGAARLAEIEIPKYEDNEKTVAELRARIEKTVVFLKTIKPEQIIGKENVKVTLPSWGGKSMTGIDYVTNYLIPNFYFHIATAYSILRKNGIEIGKADYMGALPLQDL